MSDTFELKSDIDTELWELIKKKLPDLDDKSLLKNILEQYSNLLELETEEGTLILELEDQRKLAESLRKKCKNFALRVKELEDFQADQEGEIQKLKKEIRKISKGIPGFGEEKVKEKIVYREDTKTINELKEKRDALQKTLWEKNAELEQYEKALNELKQQIDLFETEKGKSYGFLVKLDLDKETSKYSFKFENISRGEFNKLMRSQTEFCKYKKIFTPAAVLKLWDKESDDLEIIDLEDAVKELRNKSDVKLTEISLPYSEYEGLKSIEKKYSELKEESETQKTKITEFEEKTKQLLEDQKKLNEELKYIKENPVIKEKVVVKQDTKELEELKAECERLRLKLFNYETGHIKVPTHGINVGNIYKVKVLGVGKDGDGFTKVNNFIIFVPNTKKDEITNVKITRVLKKYAFGKVLEGEPDGEVIDATTGAGAGTGTGSILNNNANASSQSSGDGINNSTPGSGSSGNAVVIADKEDK
jgi:predicted RNA-binding protein with TRAM domain